MKVFISHSSKDHRIVESFVDILISALKINAKDILCSSLPGHKIDLGESWREYLHSSILKSKIIFLLISLNYKKSEICLSELGASWVSDAKVIPLIIPPVSYDSSSIIFKGVQGEILNNNNRSSLDRIRDLITTELKLEIDIKSDYWSRKKEKFLDLVTSAQSLEQESNSQMGEKMNRGGFTDFIVDSSLSHSKGLNNIDLYRQLKNEIESNRNKSLDLKFNYLGSSNASNWINLSKNPSYGHAKLIDSIKKYSDEIASAIKLNEADKLDFISLGPGDGEIDKYLIHSFNNYHSIRTYYPLDLSFDLLQNATSEIIQTNWLNGFQMKAIHGDFTQLKYYKPIYDYDNYTNVFAMLGFTFGDFNESEILGKIKEGMNSKDYLIIDVRLHNYKSIDGLTKDEKSDLLTNYNNASNNRFAFGPLEMVTTADYTVMKFSYEAKQEMTVVPNAVNVITSCKNVNARFRTTSRPFKRDKINLSSTTLYSFDELCNWISKKGFDIAWKKSDKSMGFYVLQKISS